MSEEQIKSLESQPFFKGLESRWLSKVADFTKEVAFDAGQPVISEGEQADFFYLIQDGEVDLMTEKQGAEGSAGPEKVAIQTLGRGELLGWSWLVPPHRWRFDALTRSAVRALAVDGKKLREECEADPALGYELLKRLCQSISERLVSTRLQLVLCSGRPFAAQEGG